MSMLTKEKIKAIISDTKSGKIHWSGSVENELFSTSYGNVKLAVKYGTKHYPVSNPMLMMGISISGEEHKSETLALCDRKDNRWIHIYELWGAVVERSYNKSAA